MARQCSIFSLFPVVYLWVNVAAQNSLTAPKAACAEIKQALPTKVWYPNDAAYTKENKDYYNVGLADLRPACITLPTSAEDVSKIVKILNVHKDVKFAIKSGGHDPNPGHASVKDGVLIALRYITGTTMDTQKEIAYIKPGGHWSEPIGILAREGKTVVSGRLGVVGIGGYLMQGGVSFLSSQYGLAADNILEYETIMANGSIVNIKADTHRNLVTAMRGGGDQFGIVTKFTLRAYPIDQVWGGVRAFRTNQKNAVYAALQDFIQNNDKDRKAAIIFMSIGGQYAVAQVYDGPTPPKGAFRKFEEIPALVNYGQTMSYPDLIDLTNSALGIMSTRTSFSTITLPLIPDNPGYIAEVESLWNNITAKYLGDRYTVGATMTIQPFPKTIGKESEIRGGNAMGLRGSDHDRFILELAGLWLTKADDGLVTKMTREFTEKVTEHLTAKKIQASAKGQVIGEYNPIFMNDSGPDQDVMSSYRDAAKFRALQREVDPEGFFSKRAGGYKYKS